MRLSASNLELIRTRPQSSRLFLSVFQPRVIFRARVNDGVITKGARTITYDSVTEGVFTSIESGMTMWIGSSAGTKNIGKTRIKSATSSTIEVAENSDINWADNQFITVLRFFEVLPVYPRIISDPSNAENVIFFKDYDVAYTNQNAVLGSLINMGSHRAALLENGSASLWYTSSGTTALQTGVALSYDWFFEGGSPSGSVLAHPGNILYSTPGHYVTRLIVSGSNGSVESSYRYSSIYNPIASGVSLPYLQWEMDSLRGSRDEGGYTASIKLFQPSSEIVEGSVIVIFSEDYYGSTKVSLGGNGQNNAKIFFVGYVMDGSIEYDYEKSTVSFDIGSISSYMREMEGFSISVESSASPSTWYQLLDMDIEKAIYHYLKWHSTVTKTVDFEYTGDNPKVQFFDADRSSLYDAIDNFLRSTIVGKMVSDRQGKLWAEPDLTLSTTGSIASIMDLTYRDWRNSPNIDERSIQDLSYLEMGGIAYSGAYSGTFAALMSCAPGATPAYRGGTERQQGLALNDQAHLDLIVKNLYAFKNYPYSNIDMELAGAYRNLDIAPQEPVNLIIRPEDTVRRVNIRNDFNVSSMDWEYDEENGILLPSVSLSPLVNGDHYEPIIIPGIPDEGGFATPPVQTPRIPSMSIPASFGAFFGGASDFIRVKTTIAPSIAFTWEEIYTERGTTLELGDTSDYILVKTSGIYLMSAYAIAYNSRGSVSRRMTLAVDGGGVGKEWHSYQSNTEYGGLSGWDLSFHVTAMAYITAGQVITVNSTFMWATSIGSFEGELMVYRLMS